MIFSETLMSRPRDMADSENTLRHSSLLTFEENPTIKPIQYEFQ